MGKGEQFTERLSEYGGILMFEQKSFLQREFKYILMLVDGAIPKHRQCM